MDTTTGDIRRFLRKTFNDSELTNFCFDYFPHVWQEFTVGMTLSQKIQLLLEYSHRQGKIPHLLRGLERERPQQIRSQLAHLLQTTAVPTPQPVPIQPNPRQIFISHAHQDAAFAQLLAEDLREARWEIWIAPESIQPGEKFDEAIERGLIESGIYLVVLTPVSVQSKWVRDETNAALRMHRNNRMHFLPLMLKPCEVPPLWSGYLFIPFDRSYSEGFDLLRQRLGSGSLENQKYSSIPAQANLPNFWSSRQNTPDAFQSPHELKLLLVGEGGVGKTSLVERLIFDTPPSDRGKTAGVDIHYWKPILEIKSTKATLKAPQDVKRNLSRTMHTNLAPQPMQSTSEGDKEIKLKMNIWDFGGQEIYHATHQIFFTRRSIYLLVLDARQGEIAGRLDYWLKLIKTLGSNSPIIIAVNKSDQHKLKLDERRLKQENSNLQTIVYTSCTTGDGISQLRKTLAGIIASMKHIYERIPGKWVALKEIFEEMKADYVSYDTYVDLCVKERISEEVEQQQLLQYLHDLGVVLNFSQERGLEGAKVLNPEWITKEIYDILNSEYVNHRNGRLHVQDLDRILLLKSYPRHMQDFIIALMIKFELCFPSSEMPGDFLIPSTLPKEEPRNTDEFYTSAPHFQYHYKFLPDSVFLRLMARLHTYVWQHNYWRSGVILQFEGARALIKTNKVERKILVWLKGEPPQRCRPLLSIIRAQLKQIHASFAKLDVRDFVLLPDQENKTYPYAALLNLEKKQINEYYDATNDVYINVQQALNFIEVNGERDIRPLQKLLNKHFNNSELKQLCFDLDIDYENLSTNNKIDLTREMLLFTRRYNMISKLISRCKLLRPTVNWQGNEF